MHVFITGASSGIGQAIAREYIARGADVTLVARRKEPLARLADEARTRNAGGRAQVIARDLAAMEDAPALIAEAEASFGPIDVLVNNAGAQIITATHQTTWADGLGLLQVNVFAPMKLTLAVLPGMVARKAGTIVDISSLAALSPTPGMYFYSASKAALAAASEGLRAEIKPFGVHVLTVYPGPVKTPMEEIGRAAYEQTASVKQIPTGTAEVLARLVADGVRTRRERIIYPRVYTLARHFPAISRWLTDRLTPPIKQLGAS